MKLNLFSSAGLLLSLTCFILVFITLIYGKKKVHRIWGLFNAAVGIWGLGAFWVGQAPDAASALLRWKFAHLGIIFIPIFLFHVSCIICGIHKKYFLFAAYLQGVLFSILTITNHVFIKDVRFAFSSFYYLTPGIVYPVFFLIWVVIVFYSHYQLFLFYLKSNEIVKNKILYLFLGTGVGFLGGITNFLPVFKIDLYPFGNFTIPLYCVIVSYAILRYQLMDIRIVITRAGIFFIVYSLVLGFPFWLGYVTKSWLLSTGLAVVLATASPFVYIFLVRKAEDILFRDQRHYQNTLRELSKTLIRIRSLDQLSRSIVLTIANTVKTSFAAIYLKEEETKSYRLKQSFPETAHPGLDDFISYDSVFVKTLERHKRPFTSEEMASEKPNSQVGLIVPCFMEDDLLGFIVLGTKTHNQVFTPDDMLIFETFSYSASLAIENCIFWKEIEDRHRKARLQEMDTFSYSLAHEIDNPMTFVYNLARFLKSHFVKYITESKEREEVEEMCDIIKEGSQRVMSMVKAIRQFGQKTSGELEPLNLQETIEGFFKLYSPELKANFVLFSKDLPQEPIYVKGAAAELQQVLIILSKNALHAMQSSQNKQLTLKLSKVNHNTARVEVIDTGYGIRKESLHTIFEPFFTTKASSEGTGMGLHNAKGFIIRHKGRIWAESEGSRKIHFA